MFELQDSKGNRFRLSRGGQSQEHAALALEGNPLQVKRLLKFCDSIALVRAYSFFFASTPKRTQAAANSTHAKRHRNTLLITRGNQQNITASNIPKAQRPAVRTATPEERLFKAIANGELQLAHTHKVAAFNVTRAEKELGLTRSKLLSDCNALVLEKKRLAGRGQQSSWGLIASTDAAAGERKTLDARARIVKLNYQRFCASLPNVKKVDGARELQSTTGSQSSADIQARDMLKALGFATTKVSTAQFQRAQQQLEQIWKSKNLYKQAREFSSNYAKTHKSTEQAADKDLATYELTLCLLLCHDQPIHALASPAPEQINLFSRYKTLGRGFWKAAETARAIEAERETIAGRATAAKFDDLAKESGEERERNTPPATLTFIEITLLDDKGEPVANEAYWVKDPEGNEHTGNLDANGFARIDSIKPGNCQVAFPEIEGSGISQCRADVDCCTPPPPTLTYIEVKLVDDQGNPVANEDYVIECPEGNTYEGQTNAEGIARVDDILEGNCKVSFPNFSPDSVQVCDSGGDCCNTNSKAKVDPNANTGANTQPNTLPHSDPNDTLTTALKETTSTPESRKDEKPPAANESQQENYCCAISIQYNDIEATPAVGIPYRLTLKNGETRDGILNKQGKAEELDLPFLEGIIEFFPDNSAESIEDEIKSAYRELDSAIDQSVAALKADYASMPPNAVDSRTAEVREELKAAIEAEIATLRVQAEEYDALSFFGKTWEQSKAAAEGLADGVVEYLPDFGEIGDLLDSMDIGTLALIDAIATGDISELENQFKQWQERTGAGYEEASEAMETLIILLSDQQTREILASTPKRFLEAMPDDELTRIGMSQATQVGLDTGAVIGSTLLVGAVSGPGGAVAGAATFAATTGRKAAKAFEAVAKTLNILLKALKKKRNKTSHPINAKVDQKTNLPDNKNGKQDDQQKDQNKKEVRPKISLGHNGKLKAAGYHQDLNECIPAQLNLSVTGPGAKEFSGTGKLILEGNGAAKLFEDKKCTKEITNRTFTARQLDGNGIDIYVKATKMEDLKWRLKLQK